MLHVRATACVTCTLYIRYYYTYHVCRYVQDTQTVPAGQSVFYSWRVPSAQKKAISWRIVYPAQRLKMKIIVIKVSILYVFLILITDQYQTLELIINNGNKDMQGLYPACKCCL